MTHFWPGENSCGFDWLTQLGFSAAGYSAGLSAGAPNKSWEHIGDYIQGIWAFRSIEIIPGRPNFLVFVTPKQTSWLDLLHSAPRVWTAASPPGVFLPAFIPALEPQALLWPLHHCLALRPGLRLNQLTGRENLWGCWIYSGGRKCYLPRQSMALNPKLWKELSWASLPQFDFRNVRSLSCIHSLLPGLYEGICMLSWAWASQTHFFPAS